MKICHLTSVHPLSDTRIFYKECCSLVGAGFEVHYIVPGESNQIISGVHVHGVTKENGNRLKRMTKTVRNVYKKAKEINADVYHFHDPELIPIGLKLKKMGKKVIYDVHEDVPRQILNKTWLPFNSNKLISLIFEFYEKRAAKDFDIIISATPFINDRFIKLNKNSYNINNFPILKELYIETSKWSEKDRAVCYVGGISKYRGIEEMVDSMKQFEEIKFLLGGTFSSLKEKEDTMKMVGWEKVEYMGHLEREEVREVYRRSICGLVVLHPRTNYIDSLPVKMFEYMAAGIPVIASNFSLWKSIIESNNCGICVNPLNSTEVSNAIKFFRDNPQKAEEMGNNGRKAVESKYNWELESEKLIKAYENILI